MIVILNPQVNIPFAWRDFWAKHPCVDGVQVLFRVLHHKRPHLYGALTDEDLEALAARPHYGAVPEGHLGTYTGTVDLTFDSQEELWVLAARALQDIDPQGYQHPGAATSEALRFLVWWAPVFDATKHGHVVEALARAEETSIKVLVDFDALWARRPCSVGVRVLSIMFQKQKPKQYPRPIWWETVKGQDTLVFPSRASLVVEVAEALAETASVQALAVVDTAIEYISWVDRDVIEGLGVGAFEDLLEEVLYTLRQKHA